MGAKKGSRRDFLKKAFVLGAAASVGAGAMMEGSEAKAQVQPPGDNGVVRGYSPKREILYRITKYWREYYRVAP